MHNHDSYGHNGGGSVMVCIYFEHQLKWHHEGTFNPVVLAVLAVYLWNQKWLSVEQKVSGAACGAHFKTIRKIICLPVFFARFCLSCLSWVSPVPPDHRIRLTGVPPPLLLDNTLVKEKQKSTFFDAVCTSKRCKVTGDNPFSPSEFTSQALKLCDFAISESVIFCQMIKVLCAS